MLRQVFPKHRDKLILLAYPLLLTSINNNWIFTPVTNYMPDPWFYLAYFRYFFDYAPVYPSTINYFVERLTWNVPGYFIHHLFPALQANYVLHLLVYYVSVFSLYGILKLLYNHRTALVSALLMGSYPWFLRAVGWDYTDGTGVAHMFLLLACLTFAVYTTRWKALVFFAGVVHASLLTTNLFWIGFSPSWAAYFFLLAVRDGKFRAREFGLVVAYFIIGNFVMVGITGLFSYQVTGNYFFLEESVRAALFLTSDAKNESSVIVNYGHLHPYWHVLPAVLTLASTWKLFASRQGTARHSFVAIYLLFILAYGWLIFWHFYSVPFLIVFPYSSFALPAVFLLLGSLLSSILVRLTDKQFATFTIISISILILPLLVLRLVPSLESLPGNVYLISCCSILLLCLFLLPWVRGSALAIMLVISFLFFLVGEKAHVYVSNPRLGQDNFMGILSATDLIDAYYPDHQYKDFRLWYRADENYDTFFCLGALYLHPWGSVLGDPYSSKDEPDTFTLVERDLLQTGDQIVILSSNPDPDAIVAEANQVIAQQHLKLSVESSGAVRQGHLQFFIYFTEVNNQQ